MKKFGSTLFITLILVGAASSVVAQPQPRRLVGLQSVLREIGRELGLQGDSIETKCGTAIVAQAYARWRQLPIRARMELSLALQRPAKQKDRLSPSKRFRIHYDTTGVDAPALLSATGVPQPLPNTVEQYVDSAAVLFDFCLRQLTDSLGFAAPPSDGAQGGGSEYDVYIGDLGSTTFGQTSWQESIDLIEDGTRQRYSTYIEIDNDYFGHRTSGMNGLRVTAAHELLHAIQVGSYGIWNTSNNFDFYFYEISSVWMEDVLFTWVNDYYFDLASFFRRFRDIQGRSLPFTTYVGPNFYGYERSVWAHFLAKRFSRDVIREIWEGMKTDSFLPSLAKVLQRHSSTIESEFALFGVWNFFTADRADTVRYYDEGRQYPRYLANASTSFSGLSATVATSGFPLSMQFYQFAVPGDTVTAIVANVEVEQASLSGSTARSFEIRLSTGQSDLPYQKLSKGYVASFSSEQIAAWRMRYLESSTRANASAASEPVPNPIRLSRDLRLTLELPGAVGNTVQVFFLSTSLDLVHSGNYPLSESLGKTLVYVPVPEMRSALASGVYFVVARTGGVEYTWKIAIVQ